tara:strand:- start:10802 stop:11092 length:291 start_codon:yes stop_codon:yes gene_type:complete
MTKKDIKIGQVYSIHRSMTCLPNKFDNTNSLKMATYDYMLMPKDVEVEILEVPKRYRSSGGGYTGDMVLVKLLNSIDYALYLAFWSDFKNSINANN